MQNARSSVASRWVSSALAILMAGGCSGRAMRVPRMPPAPHADGSTTLFSEAFDLLDPAQWREVVVKGQTHYSIDARNAGTFLKAHATGGASILLHPVSFDPNEQPWLSWRWQVERFVDGENLYRKEGSDASARVYVYFETRGLPWQKRNIDYVWSRALPVGTILNSAFSKASKIVVVDSGTESPGAWRSVSRNIKEDYQRCFGKAASPRIIAIGLMADADNTRSEALAYFDDVAISRSPPAQTRAETP